MIMAAVLLLAAGAGGWYALWHRVSRPPPWRNCWKRRRRSQAGAAFARQAVGRVLPFESQATPGGRLAGGLTETSLLTCPVPGAFVIARNSTEVYKGKPVDVRQVAPGWAFSMSSKAACRPISGSHHGAAGRGTRQSRVGGAI
jgi:hypothetical protein